MVARYPFPPPACMTRLLMAVKDLTLVAAVLDHRPSTLVAEPSSRSLQKLDAADGLGFSYSSSVDALR